MFKIFFYLITIFFNKIKSETCESITDCSLCLLNNCYWNSYECEINSENNINNKREWWELFSQCDNNNQLIYCGDPEIKDLNNEKSTLTLKNIDNGFCNIGLFCSYYFNHQSVRKDLNIQYLIKTTIYNIAYPKISLNLIFVNNSNLIIDLNKDMTIDKSPIKKVELYILCYEKYYYNPFSITFVTNNKNNKGFYVALIILLSIILGIILIITILHCYCKKNKEIQSNYERRESNNVQSINIYSSNRRNFSTEQGFNKKDIIDQIFRYCLSELDYQDLVDKKKSNEKCSICLESFKENEKVKITNKTKFIMTPCEHFFHFKCIYSWLNKNIKNAKCPNCNYALINADEGKLILNVNHNFSNYENSSINRLHSRRNISVTSGNNRIIRLNLSNNEENLSIQS